MEIDCIGSWSLPFYLLVCSNIDLCGGHLHFVRGINMQFSAITMLMHFFSHLNAYLRLFWCSINTIYIDFVPGIK